MSILIRTAILALALLPQPVAAQETGATKEAECDGPYQGQQLAPETLQQVFKRHEVWHRKYASGSGAVTISESRLGFDNPGRANLCGAVLFGANLSGEILERADLSEAILERADLSKADLWRADLSGADLSGADLRRANLSGADLGEADLSGANLGEADLSNADLWRADLSGPS